MNVIFTCGGTGGHINPAIAVADILKERHPDANILFIGAKGHMEEQLVPRAGYELKTLPGAGLVRKLNVDGLKKNWQAVKSVMAAVKQSKQIIREFQPDVIIGTGGYASFPALYAGSKLGVPICVHESNAVPGLTTKMIANRAQKVMVCFEESKKYYRHAKRVEIVGMPVRRAFWQTTRAQARQELGLPEDLPVVVSTFGSQGAKMMNEVMARLFALEQEHGFPFHHIHATGSFGWQWMGNMVKANGVHFERCPRLDMKEYIYNMPTVLAAADVVLGRAGSGTCNEIGAAGTPCILIPSPNVTNNHQEKNARVLERHGGAVVIPESACTQQVLFDNIMDLLQDKERCSQMSAALRSMVILDSAERICDILEELATG